MKLVLFLISSLIFTNVFAVESPIGLFSGRISRMNTDASFIRVKVDFSNLKYVNKKDIVELWNENNPNLRCRSFVLGKSPEYVLLKIPDFRSCKLNVGLRLGLYLKLWSKDLVENIDTGKDLMKVLLKKKLALDSKLKKQKKELDIYIEKVGAVNERYQTLMSKLDIEWKDELTKLEEDRVVTLRNYRDLQARVDDLNFKIQKYRVEDENLKEDRWALDPKMYYKK